MKTRIGNGPWLTFKLTLGVAALAACGPQYDTIGQLDGLRVMGVEKSAPTPEPGEIVEMRMLVHDTGPVAGNTQLKRPDVQVAWLSGCTNPPADLYQGCFAQLGPKLAEADLGSDLGAASPEQQLETLAKLTKAGIGFGMGPTFQFQVPTDIISGRDGFRGSEPYGLSYVFFAACAGNLEPDLEGGVFPLRCVDDKGVALSARDFVAGYTGMFSYATYRNRNPVLVGYERVGLNNKRQITSREAIRGKSVCIGSDCEDIDWDGSRECDGKEPQVSRCADEDQPETCPKLDFAVKIDPDVVDKDTLASRDLRQDLTEQVWVNYHADRGSFLGDLSLLNDPSSGLNADSSGTFIAPGDTGKVHIWTVVRDGRGGTSWGRFDVCVVD